MVELWGGLCVSELKKQGAERIKGFGWNQNSLGLRTTCFLHVRQLYQIAKSLSTDFYMVLSKSLYPIVPAALSGWSQSRPAGKIFLSQTWNPFPEPRPHLCFVGGIKQQLDQNILNLYPNRITEFSPSL